MGDVADWLKRLADWTEAHMQSRWWQDSEEGETKDLNTQADDNDDERSVSTQLNIIWLTIHRKRTRT